MSAKRWLVAWVGRTDHQAAESAGRSELGPIATAVKHGSQSFDRIYLLTNYAHDRSVAYCDWLSRETGCADDRIDLFDIDLPSPIDYDAIYREVSKNLADARLPRDDVELTFHLSPGTPAMTVVWVILAKTRFPAKLIQTDPEGRVLEIPFLADIASDFLPEFLQRSSDRIERLTAGPADASPAFAEVVHRSPVMAAEIARARKVAVHDVPVLILGETGTGKELFANAIHASSTRASGPFIPVNCGAMSPELANSELFGHVKGAFTDAKTARKGHFVEASGGTLFLDEIGDLPPDAQVRLLRVLQAKQVTPVGSSTPVNVDVRIVAATHRDLAADVASGRYREDLFHRLAVGILRLPALRERETDVELLLNTFLAKINADARGKPEAQEKELSAAARKVLLSYHWPGNVREMYHTLVRAAIWSQSEVISGEEAEAAIVRIQGPQDGVLGRPLTQDFDLQELLDMISRDYMGRALKQTGFRKSAAAKLLGFGNHQTFSNWMDRLGVNADGTT